MREHAFVKQDVAVHRDRARGDRRTADVNANDVWLLPLDDYVFTSPYGIRWGKLHAGVDLAAP